MHGVPASNNPDGNYRRQERDVYAVPLPMYREFGGGIRETTIGRLRRYANAGHVKLVATKPEMSSTNLKAGTRTLSMTITCPRSGHQAC